MFLGSASEDGCHARLGSASRNKWGWPQESTIFPFRGKSRPHFHLTPYTLGRRCNIAPVLQMQRMGSENRFAQEPNEMK